MLAKIYGSGSNKGRKRTPNLKYRVHEGDRGMQFVRFECLGVLEAHRKAQIEMQRSEIEWRRERNEIFDCAAIKLL